jgi:carboxymethylenebutenolidase
MCFEVQAEPPSPPVPLLAASQESLTLTSQDGTKFEAHAGHRDAGPGGPAIVILPDVRGLFRLYRELAEQFAHAGVESVAIDYFGRTAGLTGRDDPHWDFMSHVAQTTPENIRGDVAAAIAYLQRPGGTQPRAVFTVGFCFGGNNSFQQASAGQGLSGVIGFYGYPGARRPGAPSPIERAAQTECPVLGLFGGGDAGIPEAIIREYDKALHDAGVESEMVIYPDAPHSFFDRHQATYQSECDDAWRRMLAFITAHTPS